MGPGAAAEEGAGESERGGGASGSVSESQKEEPGMGVWGIGGRGVCWVESESPNETEEEGLLAMPSRSRFGGAELLPRVERLRGRLVGGATVAVLGGVVGCLNVLSGWQRAGSQPKVRLRLARRIRRGPCNRRRGTYAHIYAGRAQGRGETYGRLRVCEYRSLDRICASFCSGWFFLRAVLGGSSRRRWCASFWLAWGGGSVGERERKRESNDSGERDEGDDPAAIV